MITRRPADNMIASVKKHLPLCIFLLLFIAYNLNLRANASVDTIPASLLPFNILSGQGLYFDQFIDYYGHIWQPIAFFSAHGGHYVSIYPIVAPLLLTPLYALPYAALSLLHVPVDLNDPIFRLAVMGMEKLSASLIVSLSGVFVFLALRELVEARAAAAAALIYGLATCTWPISSQALWQHGPSELLLSMIIFLAILCARKGATGRRVACLGLLAGLYVFNRPSDSLLLVPLLVYILGLGDRRIAYFAGAGALAALPFAAYNLYFFGNFLGGFNRMSSMLSLSGIPLGSLGLLVSPNRGLLIYSPVVLLAIPGLIYVSKIEDKEIRRFLYAGAVAALATVLLYGSFSDWHGGGCFGPRYLTAIMPFTAVLIGLCLGRFSGPGKINAKTALVLLVIALLVAYSVLIQAIGAFCYPNGGYRWDQDNVPRGDEKYWDWHDTQIMRSFHAGIWNPLNVASYLKDRAAGH